MAAEGIIAYFDFRSFRLNVRRQKRSGLFGTALGRVQRYRESEGSRCTPDFNHVISVD